MGAHRMGYFTLDEWETGLIDLQCDSIDKLRSKLDSLRMLLYDPNAFKEIYRYAYNFAKEKDQRSMDVMTAKVMLRLLLADQWPLYTDFCDFIDQTMYKVINRDQWMNIYEFARVHTDDLSSYDVDGACECIFYFGRVCRPHFALTKKKKNKILLSAGPVMLDEFVIWMRQRIDEKIS